MFSSSSISALIIAAIALLVVMNAGAEELSDPMRPYTPQIQIERSQGGKAFVVSAILYSAQRRVAVVNGQPVSEGQRINGARVKRIKSGMVELDVDGETLKLVLVTDKQLK